MTIFELKKSSDMIQIVIDHCHHNLTGSSDLNLETIFVIDSFLKINSSDSDGPVTVTTWPFLSLKFWPRCLTIARRFIVALCHNICVLLHSGDWERVPARLQHPRSLQDLLEARPLLVAMRSIRLELSASALAASVPPTACPKASQVGSCPAPPTGPVASTVAPKAYPVASMVAPPTGTVASMVAAPTSPT